MPFLWPEAEEVLAREDALRVRLADAIAASNDAADRAAGHAMEAIVALLPRHTDPEQGDR